jgi:peptidoglycan hydrolase CwlO-like protein
MHTTTNNISSSQVFSTDTLVFSKNMQKAGMSQKISEQLAVNLKLMQFSFIETLLTKDEFRIFKKEVSFEIKDLRENVKGLQNDIKDLRNDMRDLRNDMKDLQSDMRDMQKDMQEFKSEIRQEMQEFKSEIRQEMQEFKKEIKQEMQEFKKEIRGEIENLVSKKEFYSEMKNLSLNLTVKLGIIMGAGITIIGILTKI